MNTTTTALKDHIVIDHKIAENTDLKTARTTNPTPLVA